MRETSSAGACFLHFLPLTHILLDAEPCSRQNADLPTHDVARIEQYEQGSYKNKVISQIQE